MPGKVVLADIFPLVQHFRTRRHPLLCRHRHRDRCDCHLPEPGAAAQAPDASAAHQTHPRQPGPRSVSAPGQIITLDDYRQLEKGWRNLVIAILHTLRDFTDAHQAAKQTIQTLCEPGFP